MGNKAEMSGWVRSWQTLESKRRKDFPGRGNIGPETAKKPDTFKEGQERWEAGNKRKSGCSKEKRAEVQTMPS